MEFQVREDVSGLREIWEWVQSEVILNPKNSVDREFESISRIFERDNRSPLADILREQQAEFLDLLGSRLSELRDEPEADEEAGEPEPAVESIERSLEGLLQGATNMLETPIRLLDERVLPIIREPVEIIEQEIKKTGIVESIKGFFRSLFR